MPTITRTPDFFPRGVYWPFDKERHDGNAAQIGMDRWTYAERLMDIAKARNVNLLWVIHMPVDDLPRFCELASERDLMVTASADLKDYFPSYAPRDIDIGVAELTARWKDCDALIGYVGFDEPKRREMMTCEMIRRAFRRHDPQRFFCVVARPHETPLALRQLEADAFVIDPYHFYFIPGPWYSEWDKDVTRSRYTRDIECGCSLAHSLDKRLWAMPQAFVEIDRADGMKQPPCFFDVNCGEFVVVPGARANWRMPTDAELKWQCWTALRLCSRGLVPFVLLPPVVDEKNKYVQAGNDVSGQKIDRSNVDRPREFGPGMALIQRGLKPTPQFDAMGELFGELARHDQLLKNLKPTYPLGWTNHPFKASTVTADCFDDERYFIVVNDDFERAHTGKATFLTCVKNVTVVTPSNGQVMRCGDDDNAWSVTLPPGEGVILRLETAPFSHELIDVHDFVWKGELPPGKNVENLIWRPFREYPYASSALVVDDTSHHGWIRLELPCKKARTSGDDRHQLFMFVDSGIERVASEGEWWDRPGYTAASFSEDGETFGSSTSTKV
ncbi:MAG: hypothetical protein JW808_11785, partial [Victivallales bacterium]|nr:hypothetical protein [Victivallales bacterium]